MREDEKWVSGYEGLYSVTSNGEVFSHRNNTIKLMSGAFTYRKNKFSDEKIKQYRAVTLSNGLPKNHYVHRLVAEAFIPKVEGKHIVNHIDGIKTNNFVENLEWVTDLENKTHACENGLSRSGPVYGMREKSVKSAISGTGSKYTKSLSKKYVIENPDYIISEGIPLEMLAIRRTMGNRGLLDDWNYHINLFRLCDSELSLSEVFKITGISTSMISKIRNGKRSSDARLIYDKYKDNPDYMKNFYEIENWS